jgi:LuxR family transcriptional regulator, maltose regulon positive regulatory protein
MQPLRSVSPAEVMSPPVRIRTLGCLELFVDGTPLEFEGRGPRKPLELLSALIAFGPRGASVGGITDLLWPDADGFDAYRSLVTTVHRLRRLLVHRSVVHFGAGRLRLESTLCDIDVWQLERALDEVRDRVQLDAALELYVGPFMDDDASVWVLGMRSRLDQAVARATREAVRHQVPQRQIYNAVGYGDNRDVSASPRCRVADRCMDRGPE